MRSKIDYQYDRAVNRLLVHSQSIFAVGREDHFARARIHVDASAEGGLECGGIQFNDLILKADIDEAIRANCDACRGAIISILGGAYRIGCQVNGVHVESA